MKKNTPSAGSLVRTLVLSGAVAALFAVCGMGGALAQTDDTAPNQIKAAEVTAVERETVPAPATSVPKEPAFQGLIPPAQKSDNDSIVTYGLEKPVGSDTHPILKITPDKSELVRLDSDAASIVVGNPDHLGVLMDNRRLLILVPRQPGATYMTVLNSEGAVIMQRHVIIASPQADYIRIRRSCAGQGRDCQETSVYYCPGMCHQVGMAKPMGSGDMPPIAAQPVPNAPAPESNAPDENIPVTAGQ